MAWSDAAREAAAEARRRKSKGPKTVGQNQREMSSLLKQGLRKKQKWAIAEHSRINEVSARDAMVYNVLTGLKPGGVKAAKAILASSSARFHNQRLSTNLEQSLVAQGVHPSIAKATARRKLGPGVK